VLKTLDLVRAAEADIPFIMATERLPGYEELVGRWSEAEHRAALSDDRYAISLHAQLRNRLRLPLFETGRRANM
jgi:hypothetical protein